MAEFADHLIKLSKLCHTKQKWEQFFEEFGSSIATATQPKLASELFRRLSEDPHSLNYSPRIWASLIQSCSSSWNLELGAKVALHAQKIQAPEVAIPAAQVLLESGQTRVGREYAQRVLRSQALTQKQAVQLELIVASGLVEEGKAPKSKAILEKLKPQLLRSNLSLADRAEFLGRVGRILYFAGNYKEAAESFQSAAPLYAELKDWETSARMWFNAGACYQNSGESTLENAFKMVEECRRISIEHDLKGPQSFCDAFYGFEAYHLGNFPAARDHFRRALDLIPSNDKSFRRLHVMSMLCFTYFASGKYAFAKRLVPQTLKLAEQDESDRFKIRYKALEAEYLWECGKIEESQKVISSVISPLTDNGVHTLEELSALSRVAIQAAYVGKTEDFSRIAISSDLKKNRITWLDYEFARFLMHSQFESTTKVREKLFVLLKTSQDIGALHYIGYCQLGLVRTYLRDRNLQGAIAELAALEVTASRLGDTPLKPKVQAVHAGIAYQSGNFSKCEAILSQILKMPCVPFVDQFAIESVLFTVRGQSAKLQTDWQKAIVARFVRAYFAPSLRKVSSGLYVVSDKYQVDLRKHSLLEELVDYLCSNYSKTYRPEELQESVWKQTVNLQGWHQKIRNSIMRIRDLFPYTMAPLVLHDESGISIFSKAILVSNEIEDKDNDEKAAIQRLQSGPASSSQIADWLNVSPATAKRTLKKLTDNRIVLSTKVGRSVTYRLSNELKQSLLN
jgi:tetratricopeptide (TPR) repeat protein/DNA-binding transcriptional ArsR family regulator